MNYHKNYNSNNQKSTYRIYLDWKTICNYQGEGFFEETLEKYFIPEIKTFLLQKNISFEFHFEKEEKIENKIGLELIIFENNKWQEIYNDAFRTKYYF